MKMVHNRFRVGLAASLAVLIAISGPALAQKPYRMGTTTASFLEIGYGTSGTAMGDAAVSALHDVSSVYWNPAGMSYMEQSEAVFSYQPWLVGINTAFAAVGLVIPRLGTLGLNLIQVDYGDMDVTTIEYQEGTGEKFSATDFAFGFSYARKLAQWFGFGATGKYVSSRIWHTHATALAFDLGVIVQTHFFSPTGNREQGMAIGMSISNYGTKMRYDGIDLIQPIDILPYEQGNYRDVPGQFRLESWELPLIFRIGFSVKPLYSERHELTLAADALHPNNNSESLNIGGEYRVNLPGTGTFYLRGGYKALFMPDSEYGLSFGGGMVLRMMNNTAVRVEYAYRNIGILGRVHAYSFGVLF
jgi:hypothetical protein